MNQVALSNIRLKYLKYPLFNISGEGQKKQLNQVTNLEEMDEEEMLMRAIAMSLEEEEEP